MIKENVIKIMTFSFVTSKIKMDGKSDSYKEKAMERKNVSFFDKYYMFILGVFFFSLILLLIGFLSDGANLNESQDLKIKDFNEKWFFSYDDTETVIKDILPQKQHVHRGDYYQITNIVPADIDDQTVLVIHTTRQSGNIYIDGEKIFELKNNSKDIFRSYPVNKTYYVPLKKEYANKKIMIEIQSYSIVYSGRINEMYYGKLQDCIETNYMKQAILSILYFFIICVGVVLAIIYLLIRKKKKLYIEIMLLGIIIILFGMWIANEYNLFQNYIKKDTYVNILTILSKFLLPHCYLAYLLLRLKISVVRRIIKGWIIGIGISQVLICIFVLFDINNLIFWMEMYTIGVLLIFICSLILIIVEICLENEYSIIGMYLALHVLLLTILIEIFSFYQNITSYRNFGIFIGVGMICCSCIMGVVSTNKIIHVVEESNQIREELLKKRIDLMMGQIRPHFIYNTLNSIQALIEIDPEKASDLVYNFSKYMRFHVDTIEKEGLISFGEELENIKTYLNIELVRFSKIHVVYDIKVEKFLVPMLSVQPIVENSVKHGVSKKKTGGTIWIRTRETDHAYCIEIEDNGVGFCMSQEGKRQLSDQTMSQSVGMKNITYRLNQMINATVLIKSKVDEGTLVTIGIPKKEIVFDENNYS